MTQYHDLSSSMPLSLPHLPPCYFSLSLVWHVSETLPLIHLHRLFWIGHWRTTQTFLLAKTSWTTLCWLASMKPKMYKSGLKESENEGLKRNGRGTKWVGSTGTDKKAQLQRKRWEVYHGFVSFSWPTPIPSPSFSLGTQELVVGIIDYIRTFTWDKRLEMYVKSSGILGSAPAALAGSAGVFGAMPTVVSPSECVNV